MSGCFRFRLKQDGVWCDVDMQSTSILEVHFPVDSLVIKPIISDESDLSMYKLKEELVIDCTPESTAQLLALAVDHIDILLEDWYPTLGTRFVHTSEGKFLVTRLVPCPKCLVLSAELEQQTPNQQQKHLAEALNHSELDFPYPQHPIRKSQESYTSECDSGVGPDSNASSRAPSVEGYPGINPEDVGNNHSDLFFYSWMVEECILAAYSTKCVSCPVHFDISLALIAPDTVSFPRNCSNMW